MKLARQTFASLAVRNYRLFFTGMFVSASGTWMYQIAMGWLVFDLTRSGTAVGIATAMQFLPMLLGGVWGGLIADRFDKRHVLYVTQSLMAVASAGLAAVTLTGGVTVEMAYAAAFLIGCGTLADNPTRQAFVTELVGPNLVPNAVALNSAMFNTARIIGPAVGGLLILAYGTGVCFAYNAVSYAAVLVSLRLLRASELQRGERAAKGRGQVREGLRYAWRTPGLRAPILLVAIVGTFTLNYSVLLPLLAKVTFDRGPGTLGLLTSAMGAGSIVGALTAAARAKPSRRLLVGAAAGLGGSVGAVALAPNLVIAVVALAATGALTITFLSTANSMLQLCSSTVMRGRVMSLYLLVFLGSTPIGGPVVGWVAEHGSPRLAFGIGAAAAVIGAVAAQAGLLSPRGHRFEDPAPLAKVGDLAAATGGAGVDADAGAAGDGGVPVAARNSAG